MVALNSRSGMQANLGRDLRKNCALAGLVPGLSGSRGSGFAARGPAGNAAGVVRSEIMAAGLADPAAETFVHIINIATHCGCDPENSYVAFTLDASGHRDHGVCALVCLGNDACPAGMPSRFLDRHRLDACTTAASLLLLLGTMPRGMDEPLPMFRSLQVHRRGRDTKIRDYTFGILPRITDDRDVDCRAHAGVRAVRMDGGASCARPGSGPLARQPRPPCSWRCNHPTRRTSLRSPISSFALMLGVGLTGNYKPRSCLLLRTGWIARRLLVSNRATLAAVAARKSCRIASQSPVSCSIVSRCLPSALPRFPLRRGATPPIFACCRRR